MLTAGAATLERESLVAQLRADLAPFPGRAALTWRIALLCSIVAAAGMLFAIPEVAISCYLVIFLMKPDAVANIGTALGLIVLVTLIVALVVFIIQFTIELPILRMATVAFASFLFLYIGAASQLGEIGGIVALIIAFVLTLIDMAPVGAAVDFGLRYAWYLAAMPMALMAVFNLFLGMSPVRLLRQTLLTRLATATEAIDAGNPRGHRALLDLLRADNAALEQQAGFVRLLALTGRPAASQIAADVRASYRLMLAVSALPDTLAEGRRSALASSIRATARALQAGESPSRHTFEEGGEDATEREIFATLNILAGAPEDPVLAAPKTSFFFPDALTNPAYQRFALKTTAAAMICYLVYAGINWQGIHTAMVTCYVAALGSTGETVHKLFLRIGGCLIGAAMGVASILFVIPYIDNVGGLMALVFGGVLVGAWVSTGPERLSYAGVQIALAFLLTILQGFGPSTSVDAAWDRIIGILFGNLVIYLIFTQLWSASIERTVRDHLGAALAGLYRLAALAAERRGGAVPDAALVESELGKAAEALDLFRFEPAAIRARPELEAALGRWREEMTTLAREIFVKRADETEVRPRLERLGREIAGIDAPADIDRVTAGGVEDGPANLPASVVKI